MEYNTFTNTYMKSKKEFDEPYNVDIFASIVIDGYPSNPDETGASIAEIFITESKNILVVWYDNRYRNNNDVLTLIDISKNTLYRMYEENHTNMDFFGYVQLYIRTDFDDGTYTISKVDCDFRQPITETFFRDMKNGIVDIYTLELGWNVTSTAFVTKEEYETWVTTENDATLEININKGD